MKRCPECRRDYHDDTLLYCLEDGTALLQGSVPSVDEPQTAILHETAPQAETATRAQIHSTQQTAVIKAAAESRPHEIPGGITKEQSISANSAAKLLIAAVVAVVVLAGGFFGYRYFSVAGGDQINSIAVLPFANTTGDKEAEFLADGIAETLINNFTKIPELKVTARATAFRFRGREGEPLEVGRELKVDSMLTGRVMQRGDQLSVQVDLISTSDGAQIWGNRYEGSTSDIIRIQQRIATDVSSQLKLKLSGSQEQQIAKTYTQNPEAYQRYLRGRFYWNKRTGEALMKAIEEFQAAADADPSYALAYVGLGDSYLLLPEYAGTPVNEAMPKAKAFAEKGLQIDPSLGEAYASLGLINHYLWQFDEADREFQRAIEFNPNYPTVHHWYSNNLRERGDYKQALAEIKRAHDLDPLSPIININVGIMLALNGDIPGARGQFKRTVDMDPSWFNGHFHLGLIDVMDGRHADSIPHFQKSVELAPSALRPVGMLGYSLAVAGKRSEAIELLKQLEARYANGVATASNIATIHIALGEKEKAYEWLEKGFQDKDIEISRSHWYPQFNSVREEPRFKELMQRIRK
jgi:TolB-like protein/Tfp pilus assembly protein PilF